MHSTPYVPLLAALLVTACAGDDGSASTTTDPTATASESATATASSTDASSTDASSTDTTDATDATTDDTTPTSDGSTTVEPTTAGTESTTGESTSTTDGSTTVEPTTAGPTTTDDTTTTDGTTTTGGADDLPPIDTVDNLLDWLEAKSYADWPAESGLHQSSGPHGGQVRTFLNDTLFDSFDQGLAAHPEGSVAVKELWGNGNDMIGWAIEVKVQEDSDGGNGWYWYELINGQEFGGGTGVGLCTGCHGGGGTDYVLTPWPLQ